MGVPQQWIDLQYEILESAEFRSAFDNMTHDELRMLLAATWVMLIQTYPGDLDWRQWLDGFAWEVKWQKS